MNQAVRSIAVRTRIRSLHASSTSTRRGGTHNLHARYERPSPVELAEKAGSGTESYDTISTSPAATSFQDTPPPEQSQSGVRSARTLPAMQPLYEERAADKPERDWRETRRPLMVQGIKIPPKPIAPGEEDCCMSGCVHCVYTMYADDQQEYSEALTKALDALEAAHVPRNKWPVEVAEHQGAGTDTQKAAGAVTQATRDMDPSLSAFLAFENKIKKKPHRSRP